MLCVHRLRCFVLSAKNQVLGEPEIGPPPPAFGFSFSSGVEFSFSPKRQPAAADTTVNQLKRCWVEETSSPKSLEYVTHNDETNVFFGGGGGGEKREGLRTNPLTFSAFPESNPQHLQSLTHRI